MTSAQLSNASVELSGAATALFQAARLARDDGRFLRFVSLYSYGKWLWYRAGWLLGRAIRLMERAQAKLKTSTAILDSLGVRPKAEPGATPDSGPAEPIDNSEVAGGPPSVD
jgi:hypothetical protein